MRGQGGMTEALDALLGGFGLELPPWLLPALIGIAFLFLLPHIRQNHRTSQARKAIRAFANDGDPDPDGARAKILSMAGPQPLGLIGVADEAIRRGLVQLARDATDRLEETGKRRTDLLRLRAALDGPIPAHLEGELAAIENFIDHALYGAAKERIQRSRNYWPSSAALDALEQRIHLLEE